MIDIDVFDSDERIIINKACEGMDIALFTQKSFLENLEFSRAVSTEQDIVDLLAGLIGKVKQISVEEWEGVKTRIPFQTYYEYDEESGEEVPDEESL